MNNTFEFIWKLLVLAAILTIGLYTDGLQDQIAKLDARLTSIEKTMEVK